MAKQRKQPKRCDRQQGRDAADRSADRVAGMSKRQRQKEIREAREYILRFAPELRVAKGDLLRLLQVVAGAFLQKYYPDCNYGSLYVSMGEMGEMNYRHIDLPMMPYRLKK